MTDRIPTDPRRSGAMDTLVIDSDNGFSNTGRDYKLWAAPHISLAAVLNLFSHGIDGINYEFKSG